MSGGELTYSQAYRAGVYEEMLNDPSIFVLGTDLFERGGHFAQVKGLGPELGDRRVRDAPISEAAMVAAGVGAAANGARPIVDLNFIDFSLGAMDEIVNQAAKLRFMWGVSVPLVIRATSGVAFFAAQHNNSLEAWFAHTPGLRVAMPYSPKDVKGLVKTALRGDDPVIFLMHKRLTGAKGDVGDAGYLVPFGQAAILRPGRDVTIVAYSYMLERVLAAATELEPLGIDAEVVDLRTVAPIDIDAVERSVRRTGRLVVVTEAPKAGGVASAIAAEIHERAFDSLRAPIARVAAADTAIPHSSALIEPILPQVADIVTAARASVKL